MTQQRITFQKYDKLMPLKELKRSRHQRNKHPKEQVERLAKIMREHGVRHPISISKLSGEVCFGHGRWEAAALNRWESYPVIYQDFKDEREEYACVQSDNAIAAWAELDLSAIQLDVAGMEGFQIDLLGIKDFELPAVQQEPGCEEDEMPEDVETICKPGDIWQLGNHRLMCGDSTNIVDVQALMGGQRAAMVWTDPPYNVNYEGGTGLKIKNDSMSDDQFRQFLRDAYSSMAAVTIPGGSIYVAHADSEGYNFRGAARDAGWLVKQCLIWRKNQLVMGRQDYHWIHEPILYGWLDGGAHHWYGDRKQSTVLDFDRPRKNDVHPTMKPVALIEYCLNNSSKRGDVVLDLFGGSGSTMIACEKLIRSAMVMELDPKYCDVIVERWQRYAKQEARLLNGKAKAKD